MILFKLACCLLGSIGAATDYEKPPLVADLDRDSTVFYQRFREADSDRDKGNAIIDLCQLHNLVWGDRRYAAIEQLRGMRSRIVFQLKAAQKIMRKSRGGRSTESANTSAVRSPANQVEFASSFGERRQRGDELREHLIRALLLGLQYNPGPDQIALHAGSFAGDDYGPELVALIEATIHPEHWDSNGGPGHIQYYRPVLALVVRAGSVAHEDMTDLLQGLRDSGQ